MATPRFWMISNRSREKNGFGDDRGPVSYWTGEQDGLTQLGNWQEQTAADFQKALVAASNRFPRVQPGEHLDQSHVCLFVHGYNVDWQDAARRYEKLCSQLFSGDTSMGICISFDWPSLGSVLGYLPDRAHARACATDLSDTLCTLYDWLLAKQAAAEVNPEKACRAKVSMISHSMGNYLMQKAMTSAWTRKNQPLRASLINQLLMVAADVDNNLFEATAEDGSDGNAVANLVYRVTALYSGRDEVLGMSAGLKHFGTRRLGRSGLAVRPPTETDNVWDADCSTFFPPAVSGKDIHSAYFETTETIELMREILRGVDRGVLETTGRLQGKAWP
jgi:esterase/lipase superfamily enzyme